MGPLSIGVVHIPFEGETCNGDAYCVIEGENRILIAVIDGLGHGPEAEQASQRAVVYMQVNPHLAPERLLAGCHQRLRGTRGAVISLAQVDLSTGVLVHAGIGNIETRLIGEERVRRPVAVNGIVGHIERKVRTETLTFKPGDLLLMHSDGISDRFELSTAARGIDPQVLAGQIAQEHGKTTDDQTIVVVRLAS